MTADLEPDFDLEQVAEALGMSTRWVRNQIKKNGVEHNRYGTRIRFTREQVAKLRAKYVANLVQEPVTTGPRKRRQS